MEHLDVVEEPLDGRRVAARSKRGKKEGGKRGKRGKKEEKGERKKKKGMPVSHSRHPVAMRGRRNPSPYV